MRKILAFMLAAAMVLSLAACGGGNGTENNNTSSEEDTEITIDDNSVIGTWSGEFQSREDSNNTMRRTIVLYKGGTGEFTSTNSNGKEGTHFSGTWELKDDVLNFSCLDQTQGYEISVSENTMYMTNFERPYIVLYKSEEEVTEPGDAG